MKSFTGLLFFLAICLLFTSCNTTPGNTMISYSGETQGTYYRVTYYNQDTLVTKDEIEKELQAFDNSVSVYNPNSLITRLNETGGPLEVDSYFIESWEIAKTVSELSDGYFDCTVGQLVEAWGFSFKEKVPMSQHKADSLKKLVDYKNVFVEEKMAMLGIKGMHLDFNAVAQGVSVDVVSRILHSKGITSFLIDIGGEVNAVGTKPGGMPWRVGIEKPADNAGYGENMQAIVHITDKALVTSGNYRKFYVKDGVKYSHTINPKTGFPVTHTLLSATVIADGCGYADALATTMMVMGKNKAIKFTQSLADVESFLIYSDESGEMKIWSSEGFKSYLEEN